MMKTKESRRKKKVSLKPGRRKPVVKTSYPKHKLARVKPIRINLKQCPQCCAINKGSAKKCQICNIGFR